MFFNLYIVLFHRLITLVYFFEFREEASPVENGKKLKGLPLYMSAKFLPHILQ